MKTLSLGSALFFKGAMLVFAGTQVVTNHNDQGTGSLRAAIANAASGDTINFTLPTPNTITLTTGELFIDKNLIITGSGADLLTVTRSTAGGTPVFPIFHISAGNFAVTISGLTISNGNNSGVIGSGRGGGLDNQSSGIIKISECTFSDNQAYYDGGGLCQNGSGTINLTDCTISGNETVAGFGGGLAAENSDSSVTLLRCIIDSNTAGYDGAGIFSFGGTSMTITDSTISNNFLTASPGVGDGGGIHNTGTLTLEHCTIANNTNQRGSGGGIQNQGQLTANNSTFFGNTAEFNGGAIENVGPAIITNCTITENTASQASSYGIVNGGGGISNFGNFFATAMLKNTIVAENHSPTNPDVAGFSGAITSSGYNLIGDGTGGDITPTTGDQIGTSGSPIDPLLGPLADNGGPTQTCTLLPGSPAIDAGHPSAPDTDQRNYDRTNAPDIGAFELGATIPKTLANISTRLLIETGDNVLIGGFIVIGTHSKEVLLSAIGPSLTLDG
jgi:parallel beta-helix repeat protein